MRREIEKRVNEMTFYVEEGMGKEYFDKRLSIGFS